MIQQGNVIISVMPDKILVHCTDSLDYSLLVEELAAEGIKFRENVSPQYVAIENNILEAMRVVVHNRECRIYR